MKRSNHPLSILLGTLLTLPLVTSARAQAPTTTRPAARSPKPAPEAKPTKPAPEVRPTAPAKATMPLAPAKASKPPAPVKADQPEDQSKLLKKVKRFLSWFKPSTVWYLQYRYGGTVEGDGQDASTYNKFFIGRGYVTLKFKPTKWFEARVTLDTHQDDHGDWKVRLKYMYGKFKIPMETKVISEPFVEFGIAHIPWLDYEEHINYYRVQGVMFLEKNKLHNSADLGITIGTLFGKKLPKKVAKKMGDKYPGSWGSMALGFYNGGGYHDLENNNNKVVEGRVSVRPAGPYFPHIQLSYFFTYGKGARNLVIEDDPNTLADESFAYAYPRWQNNIAMLSFAHQYGVLTAQYIFGTGTQKGSQSNWLWQQGEDVSHTSGTAKTYRGASVFAEARLPWIKSSIWARWDWFDGPFAGGELPYHRLFAAYVFHFWGRNKNMAMLDFEYAMFDDDKEPDPAKRRQNQWAVTLSVQIKLK